MNLVSLQKFFRFLDQLGLGEIVIWILKQLPTTSGVQCTGELRLPGVLCTGESFFVSLNLQVHATALKSTLIQKTV